MSRVINVQGHRGCRGLRPENTLPAFEHALDLQVTTLELDLQLTKDLVPIVWHDPRLSAAHVRSADPKVPLPEPFPLISSLKLSELRNFIADQNPNPKLWPKQQAVAGPLSKVYAKGRLCDPFGIITLNDLFEFVAAYASLPGQDAGKNNVQRHRAGRVRFNMELKRIPFHPETVNDGFDGQNLGRFESAVLDAIDQAQIEARCSLQSFDHRALAAIRASNSRIRLNALMAGTAPASVPKLLEHCGATGFSPDYHFLDQAIVQQTTEAGFNIITWTVNDSADMDRVLDLGVDGVITDYPDVLIAKVQARHWTF